MSNISNLKIHKLEYTVPGRKILGPITLEANLNGGLSIIGPSGSGKTTFLRILAGLESPSRGSFSFLSSSNKKIQKPSFGFVFQDLGIFPRSNVSQNIFLGDRKILEDEYTTQILKALGLDDLLNRSVEKLSGGERQRIAIARAMVRRPQILLLDEPFANLDTRLTNRLELLLLDLRSLHSFEPIYVTHNINSAAKIAKNMIILDEGNSIGYGSYKNLLRAPPSLRAMSLINELEPVRITKKWKDFSETHEGWANAHDISVLPKYENIGSTDVYTQVLVSNILPSAMFDYLVVELDNESDLGRKFIVPNISLFDVEVGQKVYLSCKKTNITNFSIKGAG